MMNPLQSVKDVLARWFDHVDPEPAFRNAVHLTLDDLETRVRALEGRFGNAPSMVEVPAPVIIEALPVHPPEPPPAP
jgi:hypothetical protein